jgi:putative NIF3 family GTP cyclohydrolase 1 type 2
MHLGELVGNLDDYLRVRVGIVTGAGGTLIPQAAAAGLDTFITGEGPHWTFFDAEELGVNVFYAGHYATETVGVTALASM